MVRAKIFVNKVSDMPLDYDYQYWLASMLLHRLDNAKGELADFLHNHDGYRFYTFSNLILENQRHSEYGLQFDNAHFILTSPDEEFIEGFVSGLLQKPEFSLGETSFLVESIDIQNQTKIPSKCVFKTISPIYVKTQREVEGEIKDWDLYPKDGKFYENLHNNLVSKYEEYHGRAPENDFFDITEVIHFKGRRYTIAGDHRRCSEMKFKVQGSEELLNFGYQAGFGEKNAMGFGCIEVSN
ncbi:CRISPR-associated endoribonuclease Cas6 [Methanonatronarchaeum sp. AMET6-2]|uniref:CRISPR-associated endoribonuclease Cas6 n=1 Tax=Methanonatronarchaeum sp. AMET6-2 TaxID=2933293 RepID=UPI001FF4D967|nr:CRISPR-associated endoribonuclease Cas6 [Methanonatronarchaeum sp. AMET6-2]UOY10060.1 CRISPR-associated endoribonuclease Cas6 [Methanonatronarchaeum sp. AMET6-2]